MEMDVTRLSASLTVRRLEETDVLQILALCAEIPNTTVITRRCRQRTASGRICGRCRREKRRRTNSM